MATPIQGLTFAPYQGGGPNSLIASLTLNSATDTSFIVPVNGQYSNQNIWADGVIVFNDGNNQIVTVNAGPLTLNVQAYSRDYMLVDKNVASSLKVTVLTGSVQLLLYKGQPPVAGQFFNYYGAQQQIQQQIAANFLGTMSPIINSGFSEWPDGGLITSGASPVYAGEGWMLKGGNGTCTAQQNGINGINFPVRFGAMIKRPFNVADITQIQYGTALTTVDSEQFVNQLVTVGFDLVFGSDFSGSSLVCQLIGGTGTDQNIFTPFSGQTILGQLIVAANPGAIARQTFTITNVVPAGISQIGLLFSYTPTSIAGNGDYFQISRPQLDIGTVAQAYRTVPQAIEQQRCQWFYEIIAAPPTLREYGVGTYTLTSQASFMVPYKTKRAIPTITPAAANQFMNVSNVTYTPTGLALDAVGLQQMRIRFSDNSGLVVGSAAQLWDQTGASFIKINARM